MSAILNLCIFHDGSSANINKYVLGELHAKFGAFVRSVTITLKCEAKPPDYIRSIVEETIAAVCVQCCHLAVY